MPRKGRPATASIRPAEKTLRGQFDALIPGTNSFTSGTRLKPAPPPEKQLDPGEVEVDEDGLDALELMERGGPR